MEKHKYFNDRTKPRRPGAQDHFFGCSRQLKSPKDALKLTEKTQKHLTQKETIDLANERLNKGGAKQREKRKMVIVANSHSCTIAS